MDESQEKIIFSKTFRYLSDNELFNAAQVCRSWWEIAKNEHRLRGPLFVRILRKQENHSESWLNIKVDIIKNYESRPCLQIFHSNDGHFSHFEDECHCNYLQPYSYSVTLKSYIDINKLPMDNILLSLAFPRTEKTKTSIYIFFPYRSLEALYYPELCLYSGIEPERFNYIKSNMNTYFNNEYSMLNCVIIFVNEDCFCELFDLFRLWKSWFKKCKISIWGGMVDSIEVCTIGHQNRRCKINAHFTIIFISNPKLKVWRKVLDENCDTPIKIQYEMTKLKEKLQLETHSIAFIYTSYLRMKKLYHIEKDLFKEIFPKIKLFHVFGEAGFIGKGPRDLRRRIKGKDLITQQETHIMIISYD